MTTRIATCACGQLRVACAGEPEKVSLCHCLECQKRTGSAFGIAAFFTRGAVAAKGRAGTYTRPSDKGRPVRHSFCPACGSTVFWEPERMPGLVAVAVGAFADPSFPAPTQAVWDERRHAWVAMPHLDRPGGAEFAAPPPRL